MAKAPKPKPGKSIFQLTDENKRKLKVVSALSDKPMQDIVNEALGEWFLRYEKQNGSESFPYLVTVKTKEFQFKSGFWMNVGKA